MPDNNEDTITYAHVTLRNGDKSYVAFEDEATKTVAQCNLPVCVMCGIRDIPKISHPVHFWYYGDRSEKQVNSNEVAKE